VLQGNWGLGILILAFFLLPVWVYIVVRLVSKGVFRSLMEEIYRIFEQKEEKK